ncbi:2-Hydroxyacid oxidase 2-like [Antedon mediterranea]|uniref:2-Hydroxyacid oxidase 2-like n=1 Tax=Antedon mediterranea TaxID=105859 RepID=UPI003AF94065
MTEKFDCLEDFENLAKTILEKARFKWIAGGSDDMVTLTDNKKAFDRYRFRPRLLQDVSKLDTSTTLLGNTIASPIAMSPTAFHRLADYNEGEKATAKASCSANTLMVLSSFSNTRIEDVKKAAPDGLYWMQVQLFKDKRITENVVRRADAAGFKALVLTADQPVFGKNRRDSAYKNISLKDHPDLLRSINLEYAGLEKYQIDDAQTWEDIKWLKTITKLPIVVKGITTGADAKIAVQYGADAILVSNHGGRQLEFLPATIDALSEVVAAVEGSGVEVYMDGGVRRGTDVLKALARGARAVFIGRPIFWGLACNGEEGVTQVLDILKEEFRRSMCLIGCSRLSDITPSMVVHESYYY